MIEIIPNYHPIFVHFPLALTAVSTLCFVLGMFLKRFDVSNELFITSKWCLWLGGLLAIFTALTGWFAYNSVQHNSELAHQAMTLHRNIALPTAGLMILGAAVSYLCREKWGKIGNPFVAIGLTVLLVLVSIVGFLGVEVVYRHGVGVMPQPVTSTPHHHHGSSEAGHPH